jgi:uncharacterized protein YecE (DUF72 family)
MPASVVKSFAEKTGKSEAEIEKKWEEAKAAAKKSYDEEDEAFYPVAVSILKDMLGIKESRAKELLKHRVHEKDDMILSVEEFSSLKKEVNKIKEAYASIKSILWDSVVKLENEKNGRDAKQVKDLFKQMDKMSKMHDKMHDDINI